MLFILKRTWAGGLIGLAVLAVLGLGLRRLLGTGAGATPLPSALVLGGAAFAVILSSDVLLHGLLLLGFGEPYRRRYRDLAAVFRGQTTAAILAGAAMAGCGEELVFRGLGLLAEIKAEMLRALEASRSESLADLVGIDAAALTGEPWPK